MAEAIPAKSPEKANFFHTLGADDIRWICLAGTRGFVHVFFPKFHSGNVIMSFAIRTIRVRVRVARFSARHFLPVPRTQDYRLPHSFCAASSRLILRWFFDPI